MKKILLLIIFSSVVSKSPLCFSQSLAHSAPIRVVSSFSILSDIVKNIGSDKTTVFTLVPAGADAHSYQPTAQDIKNIASAKLVFINGLGFETWFDKLLNQNVNKSKIVTTSYGITPRKFQDDGEIANDPHVWWDLDNAKRLVFNVEQALSKIDVHNQALFEKNAANYTKQLSDLDLWAKKEIEKIPVANRKLITNHDSLGYLANHYGLKVIGTIIPSVGTEREPSAKEINEIIKKIKAEKVKAIFIENTVNAKLAQTISTETGAKIAPALYTDALGPINSNGDTFIKAFRYNISAIVSALS